MKSFARLSLVWVALCAACAESDTDTDAVFETALPDAGQEAGVAAVVMPDASSPMSPSSAPLVPVATPSNDAGKEAGTLVPIKPQDAGTPSVDASMPAAEAGVDSGMPTPTTPSTQCSGSPTGMPGSTANLTLNGRNYTLHIGRSVKPTEASPLVFSLHGLNMTPSSMEAMAQWDPLSDREGIIIARPAGVGSSNGWDLSGTKDFDLMKAIIEDVNTKACVDRKRIYATGFSHGGFMSFAIACRLGDIFAAVAPNAGAGSAARGCVQRPVPVYAFHGDADGIVSYSSGRNAVNSWVTHNQCMGSPTTFTVGNAQCQDWNMCSANGQVKFCTIPGGGHTYTRAATAAIWDFFKAHPLP